MTDLDRPVVDFDHHSESYARDPFGVLAQLRAQGRMLFSERHGGYWIPTRYDDVAAVAKDDLTYSSRHDIAEPGETGECPYAGIVHPGAPIASSFIEMDPPQSLMYRTLLRAARQSVRPDSGVRVLETRIEDEPGHGFAPRPDDRRPGMLLAAIEARRETHHNDLLSELVRFEVEGRALTDEDLLGLAESDHLGRGRYNDVARRLHPVLPRGPSRRALPSRRPPQGPASGHRGVPSLLRSQPGDGQDGDPRRGAWRPAAS